MNGPDFYTAAQVAQLHSEKAELSADMAKMAERFRLVEVQRDYCLRSLRMQRKDNALTVLNLVIAALMGAAAVAFVTWMSA